MTGAGQEFAFEGKRWYDVLRYVKKNNYSNIAYLQEMVAGIVPASSVRTAQAKMLDHNSHYFPIYFYELQTNKHLVQNPFYKQ
ncbi:RagB/SusD family nutrient uptake outer membrane protein [Niabella sp. W65]|nr:RagB/SusD family nutrient uptake outer membrane protein [Niabella sp. W65]MCH7363924.1 RagB/SusD family nutrient uptake outer membrane protein [Niabella sp. W65]ULT46469.1 RagB/SusD family nutrient uptake outer membrane protein [Niabella sp. I65]